MKGMRHKSKEIELESLEFEDFWEFKNVFFNEFEQLTGRLLIEKPRNSWTWDNQWGGDSFFCLLGYVADE